MLELAYLKDHLGFSVPNRLPGMRGWGLDGRTEGKGVVVARVSDDQGTTIKVQWQIGLYGSKVLTIIFFSGNLCKEEKMSGGPSIDVPKSHMTIQYPF